MFDDASVRAVYDGYTPDVRERLLGLRRLIFEVAEELSCGPVEEGLRWGEPAYLTTASKSGTTIRLHSKDPASGRYAMYVHCQTDLIASLRARHGQALRFEGTRAVVFDVAEVVPEPVLRDCIAMALTYKWRRRGR